MDYIPIQRDMLVSCTRYNTNTQLDITLSFVEDVREHFVIVDKAMSVKYTYKPTYMTSIYVCIPIHLL